MRKLFFILWSVTWMCLPDTHAQPVSVSINTEKVEQYGLLEISLLFQKAPEVSNPFKNITLQGVFTAENNDTLRVEGFCDSQDGRLFKIRFMPTQVGLYRFYIWLDKESTRKQVYSGVFSAIKSNNKGPLRNDLEHPWHLIYDNGEHYFWNSTTAYWLAGWKKDSIIMQTIDRLATLGINRIRVGINGRAHGGERWSEPVVVESENFTFKLNPWESRHPESLDNPEFDVTRFNLAHWQKLDRIISRAREKGIIVSLIFYVDGLDHACDPFKKEHMGNENEKMYYRYAVSRFAAFENVMWDIANEYHLFRSTQWAEQMGQYLKNTDPWKHLISVHGSSDFPFRKSPWVDVIMFQSWDECGGYSFITEARQAQEKTGRILPIINEEYGYEGHYPPWGCGATAAKLPPDGRSGLNRSQLAWEICMAGGYQTTGETAAYGTGAGENSGGGWINGRGNNKMNMLHYYSIMANCFKKTAFWELAPHNELASFGNLCLANPEKEYLIYTRAQHCRLRLPSGQQYSVLKIDPLDGSETILPDADSDRDNNAWQYPYHLDQNQVFILKRK